MLHNDPPKAASDSDWATYIEVLAKTGKLRSGSAIGGGGSRRKSGIAPFITTHLGGFIRVEAESLARRQSRVRERPHRGDQGVAQDALTREC